MIKNMGSADRIIRVVVALIMVALIVTGAAKGILAVIFGVLAAVFILTSVVSFCPLYLPFKLSTRK